MIGKILRLASGLVSASVAYIIFKVAMANPSITEAVYARGIYPLLATGISAITGNTSFSIAEILLYLFIATVLFFIGFIIAAFFKPKGMKAMHVLRRFMGLVTTVCYLYCSFIFFWGLNYARLPLDETMGIDKTGYTVEELEAVCIILIGRTNNLREQTMEDEGGNFTLTSSRDDILTGISTIYDAYAPDYMNSGPSARVKTVSTKNLLSKMETTGIFSPFTIEANVNMQMPDLYFPVVAAHEYAHMQGFAREDEANFIAWYVLAQSDRPELAYSANAYALSYCMGALRNHSPSRFETLYETLSDNVKADYNAYQLYWEPFRDTKIAKKSEKLYENYLNANGVEEGIESYNQMVDIMLALYQTNALPTQRPMPEQAGGLPNAPETYGRAG